MTRAYTQTRRAEQQAETRLRIVEAAIELHGDVGPAQTTFSMIAERAGVQRHTLYAHFPDERSLILACSGLHMERNPLPDAETWRGINDREERLRTGLLALYGWYERNAALAGCVLRDSESHTITREVSTMRWQPPMDGIRTVLGKDLAARQRAVLELALSFFTWRTLVEQCGLTQSAAAEAMIRAICAD